jgi:hypothetical protein
VSWSYSGDPSASDKDAVRFLSGDTLPEDQLVSDEEIAYAVTTGGSHNVAAAIVCEAITARFSRLADSKVGPASAQCSQKAKHYRNRAQELRNLGAVCATPTFGVQSKSEKSTLRDDSDAVQPWFERGQTDYPGTDELGNSYDPDEVL